MEFRKFIVISTFQNIIRLFVGLRIKPLASLVALRYSLLATLEKRVATKNNLDSVVCRLYASNSRIMWSLS